jgi:hypothetical protein
VWGIARGDAIPVRVAGLLLLAGGAGVLAAIAPPCMRAILAPGRQADDSWGARSAEATSGGEAT